MDLHAYRFGSFLLDPAKRILLRDDAAITLPPKAFDVIVYLLEQRERAVGRDELIAAVWGKVDITDNALGQVVLQARRALDDSGDGGQRIIRTVPRFGYRWAAAIVREAGVDAAATAEPPAVPLPSAVSMPASAPLPMSRASSWRRWAWPIAALVLLALIALLGFGTHVDRSAQSTAPAVAVPASLVVLPAVVEAPAAFGWVRLGVMDLVAHRLRTAGQAIVPSDNVVGLARRFSAPGGGVDAPALLRAAGASALIEVRARLRGDRWQVVLLLPARALRGEGEADDVIAAARIASDRLALALGLWPPPDADMPDSLAALLQQVRAAILSEQLDTARSLLLAADDETRARPEIRYHLAEIDFRAGRLDAAARALDALLVQARADDRPDLRPRILNTLANIAYQRNDPDAVATWSERALQVLGSEDDASETGRALIGRASARQAQHRYDEALADFAQARIALEATGDRLALARVDAYRGLLEVNRDRVAEALPVLRSAALQLQAFDAVVEELHARVGIVMAELAMLEPAAALAQCTRLDELAQRVSDPRRKHYAALVCIDALVANGRLGDASLRLQALRAHAQPPERTLLQQSRVQLHRIAATLAQALGQPEAVVAEATAALALPADYDSDDEHARMLLQLARAQRALGRADALATTAGEVTRWAERHPEPAVRLHAALTVAEQALADDDPAAVDRALAAALADADASRVPAHLLEAVQASADHLLGRGDVERASAVVGRVSAWSERSYEAALLQLRLYRVLRQAEPWRNALSQASALAGERVIPAGLRSLPPPLRLDKGLPNDEQTLR